MKEAHMATIIAGRFDTQDAANQALDALERAGFSRSNMQAFYLSPPGQHGNVPVVDNEHPPVGTHGAGKKAIAGALVGGAAGLAAGLAAAPLAVPAAAAVGALSGAGVGAYGSSLAGAVSGSGGGEVEQKAMNDEIVERHSGMMLAVNADATGGADNAVQLLRQAGAVQLERAEGEWRDGEWVDFDPLKRPEFID
jgi:hypothetical protein